MKGGGAGPAGAGEALRGVPLLTCEEGEVTGVADGVLLGVLVALLDPFACALGLRLFWYFFEGS